MRDRILIALYRVIVITAFLAVYGLLIWLGWDLTALIWQQSPQ